MLEGEENLTLKTLNLATQAWVEQEYNRTPHSEIKATPLERYLQGPSVSRPSPSAGDLADAFRLKASRRQRRSDGSLALEGQRFEVPGRYGHLALVHLRYARWDLGHVDLVDPREGLTLCPIHPINKAANASGQRKRRVPRDAAPLSASPPAMAPLLKELIADYAASGLPPAYLPITEEDPV